MTKIFVCFALLLIFVTTGFDSTSAQNVNKWRANQWNDIELDKTSAEDAVRIWGKPDKDRIGALPGYVISKWLSGKQKDKVFRVLVWYKKNDAENITLSFFNDKLVAISVAFKTDPEVSDQNWFSPDSLKDTFNATFTPIAYGKQMSLAEFEKFPGEPKEKLSKQIYFMMAVAEKSFVVASVSDAREEELQRGLFGSVGKNRQAQIQNQELRERNAKQEFPGRVSGILLISKRLQEE